MHKLLKGIEKGDEKSIARAITLAENNRKKSINLLKNLYRLKKRSYLIGITGPPGSGKSTLTEKLVQLLRKEDKKIGIIAIDPTSQYSGGALLGDRIRMNNIVTDKGVFIRSMATRGLLGGLNPSIFDTILILSAADYEYIVIETVGVGQNEIDIVNIADTTMVVTVPEAGDEIQTFKAGLMESGDIFVLNKADLPGNIKMEMMVKQMIEYKNNDKSWTPPLIKTIAKDGEGIDDLLKNINLHHEYLKENELIKEKRYKIVRKQLINNMEEMLRAKKIVPIVDSVLFNKNIEDIYNFKLDPYTAAENLLARGGGILED